MDFVRVRKLGVRILIVSLPFRFSNFYCFSGLLIFIAFQVHIEVF